MAGKSVRPPDITGKVFGKLTAIKRTRTIKLSDGRRYDHYWLCQCTCGATCEMKYLNLINKNHRPWSCGCAYTHSRLKHGASKHGAEMPEYRVWSEMHQRCENPRSKGYKDYGARGITVCERWRQFENLIADMGRRPSAKRTIERIDNDAGYSPDNCRWTTSKEQARNRRSNLMLTFNGKTQCLAAWCEELGLTQSRMWARLHYGWSVEKAFTTPHRDDH